MADTRSIGDTAHDRDDLTAVYPVCRAIMGGSRFDAAVLAYFQRHLPDGAHHRQSGPDFARDFGGFLLAYEPVRQMPFLPDVARLEHAWFRVQACSAAVPAGRMVMRHDLAALAGGGGGYEAVRLVLPCPHQFVMSPHPVSRIWEAMQPGHAGRTWKKVAARGERLFVARVANRPQMRRVSPGAFALLCAIDGGASVGRAMIAAFEAEPESDARALFGALVDEGSFVWPQG